jgi:hypothetical protein
MAQRIRAVRREPFARALADGLVFEPHGVGHAKWFNRESRETHEKFSDSIMSPTNLCFICVHLWLKFSPHGTHAQSKQFTHAFATVCG